MSEEHTHEVRTYPSGTYIDLLAPLTSIEEAAKLIRIEDVAHHLALANRYAGGTVAPYSVAQHCVLVSRHVGDDPVVQLQALLHDAPEYLLHDVSGPLKKWEGMSDYRILEQLWWQAVADRFGVPTTMDPRVKEADKRALNAEKRDLRGSPTKERAPEPFGERIEPWPWEQARDAFLARARWLGVQVDGMGPPPAACGGCTPAEPTPYETATGDTYPAPGVWVNPERQGGKPCIDGTRIPTMAIAELYASGKSPLEIVHSYPMLLSDPDPHKVHYALRYELRRLLETHEPENDQDEDEPTTPERERGYHCGSGRLCTVSACSCNCHPCRLADRVDEKQAAFDAEHRRKPIISNLPESTVEERLESIDAATAGAIGDLGKRIEKLERDLARLQQVEASARTLGHVEGVQGRGAPRPGDGDEGIDP